MSPKNNSLPKSIVIMNEDHSGIIGEYVQEWFPEADVRGCGWVSEYLYIQDPKQVPDFVLIDASEGGEYPEAGAKRAMDILLFHVQNNPEGSLPHIVLISTELSCSIEARDILLDRIKMTPDLFGKTFEIRSTDINELQVILAFTRQSLSLRSKLCGAGSSHDLRLFLREHYDLHVPLSEDEYDKTLLSDGLDGITSEEIVRLIRNEKLSLEDGLPHLQSNLRELIARVSRAEVSHTSPSLLFLHGIGTPTFGPVAFDEETAKALASKGTKPVYVATSGRCAALQAMFPYVAGLVIFSGRGLGHITQTCQSYGIPFLGGLQTEAEDIQADYSGTIDDCGADRRLSVYLGLPDAGKLWKTLVSGDAVTMNPFFNTLCLDKARIRTCDERHDHPWLDELRWEIKDWIRKENVASPKFKVIVDSIQDLWIKTEDGIGLVRSESLLQEDEGTLRALKQALLGKGGQTALRKIEEGTAHHLDSIYCFTSLNNQTVRYRLLDALPGEIMNQAELQQMGKRYGDAHVRAIKQARRDPSLYRAQLRGLFSVTPSNNAPPLEILIPMPETADDVRFVTDLAAEVAAELGVPQEKYRIGAMVELVEAGRNIETIVPLCDFLSLGGNDYTADHLNCPRDDWDRLNQVMKQKRRGENFFRILDPDVAASLGDIIARARAVKPAIEIDFCGQQAENLASLERMRPWKLNAVSVASSTETLFALPFLYHLNTFELRTRKPDHPKQIDPKNEGNTPFVS